MTKMSKEIFCKIVDSIYEDYITGDFNLEIATDKLRTKIIEYLYGQYFLKENTFSDVILEMALKRNFSALFDKYDIYKNKDSDEKKVESFSGYVLNDLIFLEKDAYKENEKENGYSPYETRMHNKVNRLYEDYKRLNPSYNDSEILEDVAEFLGKPLEKVVAWYNHRSKVASLDEKVRSGDTSFIPKLEDKNNLSAPDRLIIVENVKESLSEITKVWQKKSDEAKKRISLVITYRMLKKGAWNYITEEDINNFEILNRDFYEELVNPNCEITSEKHIFLFKYGKEDSNTMKRFKAAVYDYLNDEEIFRKCEWLLDNKD